MANIDHVDHVVLKVEVLLKSYQQRILNHLKRTVKILEGLQSVRAAAAAAAASAHLEESWPQKPAKYR